MINHLWTIVVFSTLFIACNNTTPKNNRLIAEVNDKKLYLDELQDMFPEKYESADSLDMASSFVNNWIRKNILVDEAEKNISRDVDIQRLVDDYRSSLILDIFEKKLVSSRLDTVVTQSEIEEKYLSTKEQFYLKNDLAKCRYAKIPEKAKGLDRFNEDWKSNNKSAIREFCKLHCKDSLLNEDKWYFKDDISEILPSKFRKKITWQTGKQNQQNLNDFEYFLYVKEIIEKNEVAPIEFVQDKIVKLIIHERKKNLVSDYEDTLLKEKINSKQVILHE